MGMMLRTSEPPGVTLDEGKDSDRGGLDTDCFFGGCEGAVSAVGRGGGDGDVPVKSMCIGGDCETAGTTGGGVPRAASFPRRDRRAVVVGGFFRGGLDCLKVGGWAP